WCDIRPGQTGWRRKGSPRDSVLAAGTRAAGWGRLSDGCVVDSRGSEVVRLGLTTTQVRQTVTDAGVVRYRSNCSRTAQWRLPAGRQASERRFGQAKSNPKLEGLSKPLPIRR